MKIAVNTRLLIPNKLEGIGYFTHRCLSQLCSDHPEVEWIFIFDRAYDPSFIYNEHVKAKVLAPPTRHPFIWYFWFEWLLPRLLKRERVDLFLSPDGYLVPPGPYRQIPVMHDLNFEHHPEYLSWIPRKYMQHFFPKSVARAQRIATVSEYSKQDLVATYGAEAARIDVVPNGVDEEFAPIAKEAQAEIRARYTLGAPFFVFVGALNPRKNLEGMMQAYQLYRQAGGKNKYLIVGEKMLWTPAIEQAFRSNRFKEDIIFTGRLPRAELGRVLASAQALTFASHFEGFGIPILEAFKAEVPVITARNSALPEVAGEAALYCDSRDPESIAQAYLKSEDPTLRALLIARGKERAQLFSWQNSAQALWRCIEKSLADE